MCRVKWAYDIIGGKLVKRKRGLVYCGHRVWPIEISKLWPEKARSGCYTEWYL